MYKMGRKRRKTNLNYMCKSIVKTKAENTKGPEFLRITVKRDSSQLSVTKKLSC